MDGSNEDQQVAQTQETPQEDTQNTLNTDTLEALQTQLNDPGTDFTQRDPEGRSLLHRAVLAQADPQLFKDLSERVDIALRDVHGRTVVDLLSGEGSSSLREVVEERVKELVLAGGEEGEKEAQRLVVSGWSLLPVSAEQAKEKSEEAGGVLERLMELRDKVQKVHKAVQEGVQEDLQQLLTSDAPQLVTAADHTGLRPLHKAVLHQQGELLKFLVNGFSDSLNVMDHMGRTALHYAAALTDNPELFQTLKDAGADDSIADLTGKTVADYQQTPDQLPMADILKRVEGTSSSSADDAKPDDSAPTAAAAAAGDASDTTTAAQQVSGDEQSQTAVQDEQKTSPPPTRPRNPTPPKEPTKPVEVTPVNMYVSASEREGRAPPPTTVDGRYVSQHLGTALTMALAEIVEKRPWDPIEYLAQWLYKHRQNLDHLEKQKNLLNEIRTEEEATNAEEVIKFKKREEQKRIQEEERMRMEEEEAARKKREQEELQRQAKEALLAQKPQLPTVREEEGEDGMVRERDEQGQTELHLLAAQSGADLVTVLSLGYSLADRDANNRTARDVAEEQGLTDNVEALDSYVSDLLEQEKLDTVRQLVLEGYDKLDTVLSKVSTDGLPTAVTDFISSIPDLQERVSAVMKAVSGGEAKEVENALERKSLALAKDVHGRSPLHVALLAGHHDIAKTLVKDFPLSLKARDNLNRTPLHYAAALSEEMMEFLKDNGADTNAKDAKQHPPAFYTEHKDAILQLKATLPAATQASGDISLAVPQITADDGGQADDSQVKEEGEQGEKGEEGEEARQTDGVLATTTAEEQEAGNQ